MSSELVYRMRTCAAALLDCDYSAGSAPRDAADLLAEASNILDDADEILNDMHTAFEAEPTTMGSVDRQPSAVWSNMELPEAVPRPCPSCGLVSARTTRITGRRLMLTCPMCSHEWEYAP